MAALVLSSAIASGAKRTDVVTLLNGDRITGEITELKRGRLEIKTDDAGTLNVEWDKVATVDAARWFEVTTSDGWRLLGSLGRTSGRYVVIRGDDSVLPLPLSDITNIVPIGKSLWAKLDGSIDAGFTYTQSSGIAQTTLNSDTEYRRPAFAFRLTASATLTRLDDDSEPDDRAALDFSYVRYRGRRWFISGAARLESNESLGLLLRSQVGAVVGQRLVNTNRAQFEVGGGLGANHEVGVDTDPTDNIEGMLVMRTSFYSYRPAQNGVRCERPVLPEPERLGTAAAPGRHRRQTRAAERLHRGAARVRQLRQRPAPVRCGQKRRRRRRVHRLDVLKPSLSVTRRREPVTARRQSLVRSRPDRAEPAEYRR